ncbi:MULTISPECIES: DUF202 domain-containing protein [Mesoflavibacter]|uniref:DUF202 domain-containing protein n=1 Tax=Mesoflavibacter profundi TaxID=2708110 RepID=A0ABT4RWR7_9FLAO|nr:MULTISPECIES: DUF202 domain-containing protein [Mesoflavibacter]MDA0176279.1 DUF202 domain-containing protein [Mesoflavibacter profundi]QIJ89914.1 hypothetical protein C7H62_2106 [Mesoflavibacter sp. HG96]QIJ92642.1 hypothetical protein C7H56_2106 [Mesoflavibacter sp. HG37]
MTNNNTDLTTRDWLAIERTKLANERTFLAYFRTFLVILGTGVTIIKLDVFADIRTYGVLLICIAPVILLIGIYRLFRVKNTIRKHYKI